MIGWQFPTTWCTPLSYNYVILDIDVEEKLNERVNGGNLDDDG